MNETAILIWAAGGRPPQNPIYDETRLLPAISAHHLEIRLERRLLAERPDWATSKLVDGVMALADDVRERTARLYTALTEILANVGEAERPLLIKGLTYRLLTGQDHTLTRSADLDLFSRDLPGFRDSLVRLGYVVNNKNPPEPFGRKVNHEYAKLNRGEIEIDLHSRFPAWRYPEAVADVRATSPADNPGIWSCVNDVIHGEVTVDCVFANRTERPGFDGTSIPVLRPEMAAIISCCHIFANYFTEFPWDHSTIRLGELANLTELTRIPDFDWGRFADLVADNDAADAVAYTFALAERWLGMTPPPVAGARRAGRTVPPRALWFARGNGGFIASTEDVETAEDVVVRSTGTADLLRLLDGTPVRSTVWYATPSAAHGIPLTRVLTHTGDDEDRGMAFAIDWDEAGLGLTVDTPDPRGTELNLLCYFGQAVIECIEHPDGQLFAYDRLRERRIAPAELPIHRLASTDGAVRYAWTIPWERLPIPAGADEIPMLLGVRRWSPAGNVPVSGMLCPLRVLRAV